MATFDESPHTLLDMPTCMLERILGYLTYDEIAKTRLVSVRIDKVCQSLLNRGFLKMMRRHGAHLKRIKTQLPRRESERRNHPLARHADILTCIETRISMLSMTYTKYMEMNLCCFIPGKVIDEVLNILRQVEASPNSKLRAHEVLQELRDISSMAIEHFDEKIGSQLKKSFLDISTFKLTAGYNHMMMDLDSTTSVGAKFIVSSPNTSNIQLNETPLSNRSLEDVEKQFDDIQGFRIAKLEAINTQAMKRIERLTREHIKYIRKFKTYASRVQHLSGQVVELKRRLDETDAKNREISTNMNQLSVIDAAGSSVSVATANVESISLQRKRNTRSVTAESLIMKRGSKQDLSEGFGGAKKSKMSHK